MDYERIERHLKPGDVEEVRRRVLRDQLGLPPEPGEAPSQQEGDREASGLLLFHVFLRQRQLQLPRQ